MKLSQLFSSIPLDIPNPTLNITGISCDSRKVEAGMLFVALEECPAQRQLYIQEAQAKGVRAILTYLEDQGLPQVIVSPDPRRDYALLAANYFGHPADQLVMIGVTGTNGKTTTTHIIKAMLEHCDDGIERKVGLIGTNENKIGQKSLPAQRTTPDAFDLQSLLVQMVEASCTHVVMEVSSHGLVQHRSAGITFQVGIFTNLSQDHLDYHHSMEEYEAAKKKLFLQSKTSVLNLDDPAGRRYLQELQGMKQQYFTYSENKYYANLYAKNIQLSSQSVDFDCIHQQMEIPVSLPIPGGFSLYNALAALTCGLALDLPLEKLCNTFPHIKGVKGRVEVVPTSADFTIIIDYAHTPNALENILLTARNFTKNRLICLFGCGGNRDTSKRKAMGEIAEDLADVVVVTSDNPRFEVPEEIIAQILEGMPQEKEIEIIPNRKEAIFWALSQGKPGDVILLAGKGHECYQEIKGKKIQMDERELVAEFFSKRFEKRLALDEKI